MKKVSVLIVEDKAVVAESIAAILIDAGYDVLGRATRGEQVFAMIKKAVPDIILMDINLSGEQDGIQIAEVLNQDYRIPIIYITDLFDKKTVERASLTNPAAYLPKPFKPQDIPAAIEIAFHNASCRIEAQVNVVEKVEDPFFIFNDRVFVRDKDSLVRINLEDILWIEAGGSYCTIHTSQKDFTLTCSLKIFHERFPSPILLRVHRSYVVNSDKITTIKGNVLMIGKQEIPTSETYREDINRRFPTI